ncbi:MAG: DUF3794 domain-containing protein [Clostridiales bacterium]|nr:DUF3794 domain-containing protein [Clostridiales bacterium]
MELEKKGLKTGWHRGNKTLEIMIDEDRNVPDVRPDMGRIILNQGVLDLDEAEVQGNFLVIQGKLGVSILYGSEGTPETLQNLSVMIPFSEKMNLEDWKEGDILTASGILEDLTVEMVHSRKIRIQAVIPIFVTRENQEKEEWITGVRSDETVEMKTRSVSMTGMAVHRRENYRVREEFELHGNLPPIQEVLWTDARLGRLETRPEDGRISLRGELRGFLLYRGEGEDMPIRWNEVSVPFEGAVPMEGCTGDMIPDIEVHLTHCDWDVKENEDGEKRKISLEAFLDMTARLFQEQEEEVISDLYSPVMNIIIEEKEMCQERILTHNNSNCRISESIHLDQGNVLQICYGAGRVLLDDIHMVENGLQMEGVLPVSILYTSSDDGHPLNSIHHTIPIHYLAEARGVDEACTYQVRPQLESLNFLMMGNNDMEVRASIGMEVMIFREEKIRLVTDARLEPYDEEKIREQAEIVGYRVQEGDTLWKLARKFYTTVERIRQINPDLKGEPTPGMWLLIVKQTSGLEVM